MSVVLVLLCFTLCCSALPSVTLIHETFTTRQTGDLTYYGSTTGGNCGYGALIPEWAKSLTLIAMNAKQYAGNDQSQGCGLCISYKGTGTGSGNTAYKPSTTSSITAYVTDQCPECVKGSIDIGKSGDGRWGTSWIAVPCPVGSSKLYYKFEGSNEYYLKMQVVGHKIPVNGVTFSWSGGSAVGSRSQDNFFVASPGQKIIFPLTVKITGSNGEVLTDSISSMSNGNLITGRVQFSGSSGAVADDVAAAATTNSILLGVLVVLCVLVLIAVVILVVVYKRRAISEKV